jgi:CheY-like chemotaxis protein/HPt (histidine-containing phosphotransfer) domain-containing protein
MESAAGAGMPYTLALIDRNMPDMDGYALARAIRARRTLAGTRLVLLSTSVGRPEDLDDFALFDRDLTKPVRQSRLYGELKALIAGESPPVYRVQTESADVSPASLDERPEILVVEDTPVNQLVAARMLEKCGFRARVAENGLEALQALAERPYAAVLMDCQMPELDGYEATAAIRDDERDGRHIPIIAMTANSMRGERERCLAAGMDDYLTKPLRSQTLKHALKRWVRDPQTPQMSQQDSEPVENGTDPAAYPALLDEGLIDDLGFDEAGLNKLFSMYFNQATGQVSELSEAISRGETDVLAKTTHQLKGSSATIGAARVSYLAAELEATAKADQLEVAPEILDRLRCGLADTTVAVAARRSAIAVLDRA